MALLHCVALGWRKQERRERKDTDRKVRRVSPLFLNLDAFQTLPKTTGVLLSLKASLALQPRLQNELPVHKLRAPNKKTLLVK